MKIITLLESLVKGNIKETRMKFVYLTGGVFYVSAYYFFFTTDTAVNLAHAVGWALSGLALLMFILWTYIFADTFHWYDPFDKHVVPVFTFYWLGEIVLLVCAAAFLCADRKGFFAPMFITGLLGLLCSLFSCAAHAKNIRNYHETQNFKIVPKE